MAVLRPAGRDLVGPDGEDVTARTDRELNLRGLHEVLCMRHEFMMFKKGLKLELAGEFGAMKQEMIAAITQAVAPHAAPPASAIAPQPHKAAPPTPRRPGPQPLAPRPLLDPVPRSDSGRPASVHDMNRMEAAIRAEFTDELEEIKTSPGNIAAAAAAGAAAGAAAAAASDAKSGVEHVVARVVVRIVHHSAAKWIAAVAGSAVASKLLHDLHLFTWW